MLSEHKEQCIFVDWFELEHKGVRIFAIPNGGKRSKITAALLKKEGVKAGVPDLYIPDWKLWIEFKKVKGGILSKDQKSWRDYLISIGDNWMLANGFEDGVNKVRAFKKGT